ncbi:MAG: sensor histidine kinase [Spirochaetales bacterium]|nr:sensor histidine kinase [Spirochaetales bacterium]
MTPPECPDEDALFPPGLPGFGEYFLATQTPLWIEDFSGVASRLAELGLSGGELEKHLRANPGEVRYLASRVRILDANQAAAELIEADSRKQLTGNIAVGFDDGSYGNFLEEILSIASGARRFTVDFRARSVRGRPLRLRMQWSVAPGHEEDLALVFVSGIDLTALMERDDQLRIALERQEVLLRELQHRVRNTLSLVISILRWQRDADPSGEAVLGSALRRVDTLATVQRSLGSSEDYARVSLRDCVEAIAVSARTALGLASEIACDLPDLSLPVETATPLALAVGELADNALRHGRGADGRAELSLRAWLEGEASLVVEVGDRGPGLDAERPEGIGLGLVRVLALQLKAELRIEEARPGTRAVLVIPLA